MKLNEDGKLVVEDEDIEELISGVVEGGDELTELRRWRRKTATQKRKDKMRRRKRRHRRKDPKRARIARKARKRFLRNKSAARMAARRASISR